MVAGEAQTDPIAPPTSPLSHAAGEMDSGAVETPKTPKPVVETLAVETPKTPTPAVETPVVPKPAPPKGKGKGAPPPPKAKFAPPPRSAQNAPTPTKAKASRTMQLQWEKPRPGVSKFSDAVLERMSQGVIDVVAPGSVWDT